MAQVVRPTSDVSTGSWTSTPLWSKVDDDATTSGGDGDFITSSDNTNGDTCEVALGSLTDPSSSSGHVIRWRGRKSSANGHSITYTVDLVEGATVRASFGPTSITSTSFSTITHTLSSGQADSISNYGDLRLRFTRSGDTGGNPSGRRSLQVAAAEVEVPDVPAGTQANAEVATGTAGANNAPAYLQVVAAAASITGSSNNATAETGGAATSFPTVEATIDSQETGNVTSHTVAIPNGSNVVGKRILAVVGFDDGSNRTVTWPAGWNEVFEETNGVNVGITAATRDVDGTEGWSGTDDTITVTSSDVSQSQHWSARLSGHHSAALEFSVAANTASTPDAPSLTPSWGSTKTLWIVLLATDLSTNASISLVSAPASYTNVESFSTADTGGVLLSIARRELEASTEDPGAWEVSASEQNVQITLAVRPSAESGTNANANAASATASASAATSALSTDTAAGVVNGAAEAASASSATRASTASTTTLANAVSSLMAVQAGLSTLAVEALNADGATAVSALAGLPSISGAAYLAIPSLAAVPSTPDVTFLVPTSAVSVGLSAIAAQATVLASDATASTTAATSADAESAAASALANLLSSVVAPSHAVATASGQAQQAAEAVAVTAATALATGAAATPRTLVAPAAALAILMGAANNSSTIIAVNAILSAGAGLASDASVSTEAFASADAEVATAAAIAYLLSSIVDASAVDPAVSVAAQNAAASTSANEIAEAQMATVTALAQTVATAMNASSDNASATGEALAPIVNLGGSPATAQLSGTALLASVDVAAIVELATVLGDAYDALADTADSTFASAELATILAQAFLASAQTIVDANAEVATGVTSGESPSAEISIIPGLIEAATVAYGLRSSIGGRASTASASGQSPSSLASVKSVAGLADLLVLALNVTGPLPRISGATLRLPASSLDRYLVSARQVVGIGARDPRRVRTGPPTQTLR